MNLNRQTLLKLILATLLWVTLTLSPWQSLLSASLLFRVLIAILIFLVPGTSLGYLVTKKKSAVNLILNGFVFSVLLVGLLGITARFIRGSFAFIQIGFILIGWVGLVAALIMAQGKVSSKKEIGKIDILFILAAAVITWVTIQRVGSPLFADESLKANLISQYFRYYQPLSFWALPMARSLKLTQFWFQYWPLCTAFIADFSGTETLLLPISYLSPALAALSLLSIYSLATTFGFGRRLSSLAVIAQAVALTNMSGAGRLGQPFFQEISQGSKVAIYILAVNLIRFVADYYSDPHNRSILLVGIGCGAMVLVSPLMFGVTSLVVILYGLITQFYHYDKKAISKFILLMGTFAIIPYIALELDSETPVRYFLLARQYVQGNPRLLDNARTELNVLEDVYFYSLYKTPLSGKFPLITWGSALLALFFVSKEKSARYLIAAFSIGSSVFWPYTAWLMGYFVTPFEISLIPLLMPFGISIAFLISLFGEPALEMRNGLIKFRARLRSRGQDYSTKDNMDSPKVGGRKNPNPAPSFWQSISHNLKSGLIPQTIALTLLCVLQANYLYSNKPLMQKIEYKKRVIDYQSYLDFIPILNSLDQDNSLLVGGPDEATNAFIPSLSFNFTYLDADDPYQKQWKKLFVEDIPPYLRLERFTETKVGYILISQKDSWWLDMLTNYPKKFSVIHENERLTLYRFILNED